MRSITNLNIYAYNAPPETDNGRYTALNAMWSLNNNKAEAVQTEERLPAAGNERKFGNLLIESLSEQGGGRAAQRARDAATDLKRYDTKGGGERGPRREEQRRDALRPEQAADARDNRRADGGMVKPRNGASDDDGRAWRKDSGTQGNSQLNAGRNKAAGGQTAKRVYDKSTRNTPGAGDSAAQKTPAHITAENVQNAPGVPAYKATGTNGIKADDAGTAPATLNAIDMTGGLGSSGNGGGAADNVLAQPGSDQGFLNGKAEDGSGLLPSGESGAKDAPAQSPGREFIHGAGAKPGEGAEHGAIAGENGPDGAYGPQARPHAAQAGAHNNAGVGGTEVTSAAQFAQMLSQVTGDTVRLTVVESTRQGTAGNADEAASAVSEAKEGMNGLTDIAQAASVGETTGAERAAETGAAQYAQQALPSNNDGGAGMGGAENSGDQVTPVQGASGSSGGADLSSGSFTRGDGSFHSGPQAAQTPQGAAHDTIQQNASPHNTAALGTGFQTSPNGGGQAVFTQTANRALADMMPEIYNALPRDAKLVLDGGKHEFMMQMKPESLGKVIMRIVTEHGAVNAKFIVENEQAKTNLETNIGQLKEALGIQGLQVQGCMVEVRHGGGQAQAGGEMQDGPKRGRRQGAPGAETGAAALDAGRRAFLRNQYYDRQSVIHFTA